MSISKDYSPYWKDLGTVLMYQSPDFQFLSGVIITEFENCLIKKLSTTKRISVLLGLASSQITTSISSIFCVSIVFNKRSSVSGRL